jgi:uncharacterized protein
LPSDALKIEVIINSRKFDGSISKSWAGELIEENSSLLLYRGVFDRDVIHEHLGLIECGTISYEYFWLDRWYNIFRFHKADGTFRNFYCNIAMPPTVNEDLIDFVDLDIDMIVDPNGRFVIHDEDEYERNAEKYDYPASVRNGVSAAVEELTRMIRGNDFPFDQVIFAQHNA